MYIPEVDWFDEFFGPVVNTKYIKALAVSLVQLTPKAGSTFWPSFSASRSNNAPITPEKAKILVSILQAVYHYFQTLSSLDLFQYLGPLNNYVDKMRGGGGQKMSLFVHAPDIKTVHAGGGGSKNGIIMSTQLLNASFANKICIEICNNIYWVK